MSRFDPTRPPATKPRVPLQIPAELVSKVDHKANGQITSLPATVHSAIFEHLEDLADKTALALTCKAHANMYNDLGKVDIIDTKPVARTKPLADKRLAYFRRFMAWRPMKSSRLCTTCQYFLPVINTPWGGDSQWHAKGMDEKTAKVKGSRCHRCSILAKREADCIRMKFLARRKERANKRRC